MHELSLANSIIDLVSTKVAQPEKLLTVQVTVGPLSGVCADSLVFGFETLARERGFERAELVVAQVPAFARCRDCNSEYPCDELMEGCPTCGSLHRQVLSGDRFTVDSIEVEDDYV